MVLFTLLFELFLMILGILSYIQGIISKSFTGFTYGKIVSIKERKHNIYMSTYSILVCYEIDGKKFVNRHMKVFGNSCDYQKNQILSIRYDELNPKRSRITEDKGYVSKNKLLIIFIIMCITAVFIPIENFLEKSCIKKVVSLLIISLGIVTYISANFLSILKKEEKALSYIIIATLLSFIVIVIQFVLN